LIVRRLRSVLPALLLFCAACAAPRAQAYSLLTHEQLIDLTWDSSIVPLLKSRYPTLTPQQIEQARAYAYGGCVIQDIGYYPFGDPFFSNLTHYVRSGDFVVNLFRNAGNVNELAFAVGALSHYIGDSIGHSEATNLAVPVEFPRLYDKYGHVVNYAEGEHQHVQTEFAFDIDEIAQHRLAPIRYLRHVGLMVPTKQVQLAFFQTYGLREDLTQHRSARINVGAYRFAVRRFIPRIAFALTVLHRHHEPADVDNADLKKLQADLAVVARENHWEQYRGHAGVGTYLLAGFVRILPKIGPLKLLAIKGPTPATEGLYIHSVVQSQTALEYAVKHFTPPPALAPTADIAASQDSGGTPPPAPQARAQSQAADQQRAQTASIGPQTALANAPDGSALGSTARAVATKTADPAHPLLNRDLDTGKPVQPAGYPLTDKTYAELLHRLTRTSTLPVPSGTRQSILDYFADLSLPFATKKYPALWAQVQADLITMRAMPVSNEPDPFATFGDQAPPPELNQ
jgi:hypothetical protein